MAKTEYFIINIEILAHVNINLHKHNFLNINITIKSLKKKNQILHVRRLK